MPVPTPPLLRAILLANGLDLPRPACRKDGRLLWGRLGRGDGVPEIFTAADNCQCHAQYHVMRPDEAFPGTPRYDVITVGGLWSRCPEGDRRRVSEFIKGALKPGGVAVIDYDAQPGHADVMPLREIALAMFPRQDPVKAIEAMRAVAKTGESVFFNMNPEAAKLLEQFARNPDSETTSKYFDPDWQPFYFRDVALMMSGADCRFVSSTMLERELAGAVPPEAAGLVNQVTDPDVRQSVLDFVARRGFRHDVFVRDPQPLPQGEWIERLRELGLVLRENRDQIALDRPVESGRVTLLPELFNPLLDALALGGRTVKPAAAVLAPLLDAGGDAPMARECLKALVGLGIVSPVCLGPAHLGENRQ